MNNKGAIQLFCDAEHSHFTSRIDGSDFHMEAGCGAIVLEFLNSQSKSWEGAYFAGQAPVNNLLHAIIVTKEPHNTTIQIDLIPASGLGSREREKRLHFFEGILHELPTNIAIFDKERKYLYVNKAGISDPSIREWIIGKTDHEYCAFRKKDPDFVNTRNKYFAKCLDTRGEVSWEETLERKDGSSRFFLRRYHPVLLSSGEIDFVIGYGIEITELRIAEISLSQSQEKYRTLVENSSDIIYTTDASGNFTYANQGAERITGITRENIVGKPFTDFIRKDYKEKIQKFYLQQCDDNNAVTYYEFPIVDAAGNEKWIGQNVRLVFENNLLVSSEAVARNITERKAAETAMLAIINSLDDVVMHVNDKYVFINAWAKDDSLLFMPAERFIGSTFRQALGELAVVFERAVDAVSITGVSQNVEYNKPETKQWFNARFSLLNSSSDSEKNISVLIEDTTDRKYASDLIEQHHANLAALIDNTEDQIWAVTSDFRLLSYNSSFAHHMRTRWNWKAEAGAKLPFNLFDQETAKFWIKSLAGAFEGECFATERIREIANTVNYDEYSFNPIRDSKNEVVGAAIFSRNITERKLAEEELKNARRIAEDSSLIRQQFIANMSHEIRTPMNAIIGSTHLLAEENLSESQRYYVSTISESSRFLLSTINDVLDLSKIDSGKLELDNSDFTLPLLLKSLELTTAGLARQKGLRLVFHHDSVIHSKNLKGDRARLLQVLINLTANAIKFTEHGDIDVNVKLVEETENNARYSFVVRDTGIGISPKHILNIFKPFRQADSSIAKKYGGTGLGLTISKKIIQTMGGDLNVISEPGKGSEFYFTVSFDVGSPALNATDESRAESAAWAIRVMIVEDHDFNRFYLSKQLKKYGAEVIEAQDGKEAHKKFLEEKEIDLILMDLRMPEMDGYMTLDLIRKTEKGKKTKVWAHTADVMKKERDKAIASGFDGFISKPVEPEKIIELLKLIGNKNAEVVLKPAALNIELLKRSFPDPGTFNEVLINLNSSLHQYVKELDAMIVIDKFEMLYELFHKARPTAAMLRMKSVLEILNEAGEMNGWEPSKKKPYATLMRKQLNENLKMLNKEVL